MYEKWRNATVNNLINLIGSFSTVFCSGTYHSYCWLFWFTDKSMFDVFWSVMALIEKKSFIPGSTCTWLKCSLFEVVRFSLNKFTVNTISLKEKVFSCLLKESRFGNSSHCKHESQTNSCHNDIAWYGFLGSDTSRVCALLLPLLHTWGLSVANVFLLRAQLSHLDLWASLDVGIP